MTLFFFTLSLANLVHAQLGKTSESRFFGDFKPIVGGWSEYQMTSKSEGATKLKIAVVGKEGDAYWYETVIEGGRQGRIITKMLVSGDGGIRRM